jgi:tRNA(Arg) A34 adenosine deaminase TadA
MSDQDKVNRRDFIATTAGTAGALAAAGSFATTASAQAPACAPPPASDPPPGFKDQTPFKDNWNKQLRDIVKVDLTKDAPELADEAVKERHRIYSYLLMKLIHRFWNGNKLGPFGDYPGRAAQKETAGRYKGDMIPNPEGSRVSWDRYIGHNIACLAVDGNGEIIDFEFNHNEFFRATSEHAESRMVRRLFSLTNVADSWKTGSPIGDKSRPALLNEVTLYTSLESCAQCSGVMSLAGVKQIVYLQNDFTAYQIGNIMYNLANRTGANRQFPGAPIPIAGSDIGLPQFQLLNESNLAFSEKMKEAEREQDEKKMFFVSTDRSVKNSSPSITSFLCTDIAFDIFKEGGAKLDTMQLAFPERRFPNQVDGRNHTDILTNAQCLKEARNFFRYADMEGYRGSPHKL